MTDTADISDFDRLEHFVSEDFDPKWNEPATRGDLRLLAIRIDNKLIRIDTKFDQFRSELRVELMRTMFRGGLILFGAIVTANLSMLGIFATLIK